MRYVYSTLALITLSLSLLLAFAVWQPKVAQAQSNTTATILADRLNVRSGPGTGYGALASVKSGEKYSVTGQSGNCAWLKIASGGKALGWISGNKAYTKLNGTCSGIPAIGASSMGGAEAPATGRRKQGCAMLTNKLKVEVKLSVKRSDGWQSSWSIPAGGQNKLCVDPGSYTAIFTASGIPGNMAFPVTVKGGEYYEIPLNLPGN